MSNLDYAAKQLNKIRNRIEQAALDAGRDISSIRLIGASKMQSSELLSAFVQQGLADLGENYLQEAIDKQAEFSVPELKWHFIGHIQSNKCKLLANHFNWVHGIDRYKIAARLSQHRHSSVPLKVLVQVNLDQEVSKSGVLPNDAPDLCAQISELAQVSLQGLMIIPKPRQSTDDQRKAFASAKKLMEFINQRHGLEMSQLSMGMSNDLEAAIAEGSTMVRIGSDLFGPRPNS